MTAHVHEGLILDDVETSMTTVPPLPHPRILRSQPVANGILTSTACRRRYVGSWEIKNGRLWLLGLTGACRLYGDEPLWADWFSGDLRIPTGELLEHFPPVYAEELLITVENGCVVRRERVDQRPKPVGWLLIKTETGAPGGELQIYPGSNALGRWVRGGEICITRGNFGWRLSSGGSSASREDLLFVAYDGVQKKFFALPGPHLDEGKRLNGSVLVTATELKENDELQIGSTRLVLMVVPRDEVENDKS